MDGWGWRELGFAAWLCSMAAGVVAAAYNRRPLPEGFALALLFGPFGVLFELLLPPDFRVDFPPMTQRDWVQAGVGLLILIFFFGGSPLLAWLLVTN